MTKEDKNRLEAYYLKRCNELTLPIDLFDFQAEIGEDLNYNEGINQLEEQYFSKIPSQAQLTTSELKKEVEKAKNGFKEAELKRQEDFKECWELLAKSRSIYILGGVRSGKSALAFSLAQKLKPFKAVYYFNFKY